MDLFGTGELIVRPNGLLWCVETHLELVRSVLSVKSGSEDSVVKPKQMMFS